MTIVSENLLIEGFQLVEAYGRIQLVVAPCLIENGKSRKKNQNTVNTYMNPKSFFLEKLVMHWPLGYTCQHFDVMTDFLQTDVIE